MKRAAAALASHSDSTLLADYDFDLPAHCIAQEPASERDRSRLLVVDRQTGAVLPANVRELADFLAPGDLLIFNDTRVVAARLRLTGAVVGELLLLRREDVSAQGETSTWRCLGRPRRRLPPGEALALPGGLAAHVVAHHDDGQLSVCFASPDLSDYLEQHGELPLPPYIKRAQGPTGADRQRYQTVFARQSGALAAPTAGLHFSETLLENLQQRGIERATVTLHVGPATFLPVRCDDAREHVLDPEWYEIPAATVHAMARTRAAGGRIVAVGTTTTRALESAAAHGWQDEGMAGWADAFLLPGYPFRTIDALFTNFHLPKSTLLMLVSAFAGRELILRAYREAIDRGFRFYSYGDAMLLL